MGVVHRARHVSLDRVVAVKRLLHGPSASPEDVDRFELEGVAAARVSHPHIVAIFDVGSIEGQPYLVMQYVEGTNLARRLLDGPLPPVEAARLLATGLPGDRLCAWSRGPAPRPQAVQHPDRPPGASLCQRLRPGQAGSTWGSMAA